MVFGLKTFTNKQIISFLYASQIVLIAQIIPTYLNLCKQDKYNSKAHVNINSSWIYIFLIK